MVYRKTRWKWHECLQARNEIIDNDSECENDDYVNNTLITAHQNGLDNEHYQTDSSNMANANANIFTQQLKLKEEAKLAIVLGAKMARMQVEFERQAFNKKRSSFYDLMGINANLDKPLNIDILEEMNIGQLQAIINDLYCLIETNNDELVNLLIERDSLSMEQDSILVDIEDLQKRVEERAMNQSKQSSLNEPTQYVYIVKRPQQNISKKSIFQNLLQKAMII
ncbi:unnamed protein product [Adineta steineri]|uniref:Schwannomin interacting protein 1 C-terminal domain-containing protein n=1 Tax=Adineta steineri TaxID=433720 RepID=A0A813QAC4_9BILA|nr:unnamed protein product [Adineta steineri]